MAAIDGSHPSTRLGTFVCALIRPAMTWSQLTPGRTSPPPPRRNDRREIGCVILVIAILRWSSLLVVVPATDHSKLWTADNPLNCRREPPLVPVERRDHLVDQGLVGQRHRAPQGVPQQPAA